LRVALDRVSFMSNLFDLANLATRLQTFIARDDRFKPQAAALLEQTLVRGEIDRGEASSITGLPVRTAQRVLTDLVAEGLLASATPKGPVSLRFPSRTLEVLFPRLCPLA
jgi:Fic family protein